MSGPNEYWIVRNYVHVKWYSAAAHATVSDRQ